MKAIRIVLCGLVVGVLWHLASAAALAAVAPEFVASVQGLAPRPALSGGFFYAIDLAMGVWAMWLYDAIVPRYRAKPAAVAIVAAAWWTLKTLQSAKWAGLGFVALGPDVLPLGAATIIAMLLATAAGVWLYEHAIQPELQVG